MIKFKKRTEKLKDICLNNEKDVREVTKVVGHLINIIKTQETQLQTLSLRLDEFKLVYNGHRHRYDVCELDTKTRNPIEQVFIG